MSQFIDTNNKLDKPSFPTYNDYVETLSVETLSIGTAPVNTLSVDTLSFETLSVGTAPVSTAPVDTLSIGTAPVDTLSIGTAPVDTLSIGTAPVDTLSFETLSVGTAPVSTVPVDKLSFETLSVDTLSFETLSVGTAPVGTAPVGTAPVEPDLFEPKPVTPKQIRIFDGSGDHIGGSSQQQDSLGSWISSNENIIAKIIADGHGKNGTLCSKFVVKKLVEKFDTNQDKLEHDTEIFIKHIFPQIDEELKVELKNHIPNIEENSNGILYNKGQIVRGGSTCSILLIFKKQRKVICVNLGDSDILVTYRTGLTQYTTIQLSGEDSPDSISEFKRIRSEAILPGLRFIYDIEDRYKSQFPPIFSESSELPVKILEPTGNFYCKNIKKHYATLVKAPDDEGLAFTRTFGDYSLKPYGISCIPNYKEYSLDQFTSFDSDYTNLDHYTNSNIGTVNITGLTNNELFKVCFIVASDGLHDNWLNKDIGTFIMDHTCIEYIRKHNNAHNIATSLITRNDSYAKKNFGNSRDNVSLHLVYIDI